MYKTSDANVYALFNSILTILLKIVYSKLSKWIIFILLISGFFVQHLGTTVVTSTDFELYPLNSILLTPSVDRQSDSTPSYFFNNLRIHSNRRSRQFGVAWSSDNEGDGPSDLAQRLMAGKKRKKDAADAIKLMKSNRSNKRWEDSQGLYRTSAVCETPNPNTKPDMRTLRSSAINSTTEASSQVLSAQSSTTQSSSKRQSKRTKKQTVFFKPDKPDEKPLSIPSSNDDSIEDMFFSNVIYLQNDLLPMARNGSYPTEGGSIHVQESPIPLDHGEIEALSNELNARCNYGYNTKYQSPQTAHISSEELTENQITSSRTKKNASIAGIAAPSDAQNLICKASFDEEGKIYVKPDANKPKQLEQTNAPRPYIVKNKKSETEFMKDIRNSKIMYYMFALMDSFVELHYPQLHAHIMNVVPGKYRIWDDLCFSYFGKTGGYV